MKKSSKVFFSFLVFALALGFVACGDKDEDETPTGAAKAVEGTYVGTVTDTLGTVYVDTISFDVKYVSPNKVAIALDKSIMGYTIAAFEATVTEKSANTYEVNGVAGLPLETSVSIPIIGNSIPVGVVGDIVIESSKKTASISIIVGAGIQNEYLEQIAPYLPIPLPLYLVFTGENE